MNDVKCYDKCEFCGKRMEVPFLFTRLPAITDYVAKPICKKCGKRVMIVEKGEIANESRIH